MRFSRLPHRQFRFPLEREARVCRREPQGPQESMPEKFNDTVQYLTSKGVEYSGAAALWIADLALRVPRGVLDGLGALIDRTKGTREAIKDKVTSFFGKAVDFFRNLPILGAYLERHFDKIPDLDALLNLVDHDQWVRAFAENPDPKKDVLTARFPNEGVLPPAAFGPLEFLQSLPPSQRQDIYMEYVCRFLSGKAVNQYIGRDERDPRVPTFADIQMRRKEFTGALGGVLGIPGWDIDGGVSLAKESLQDYYRTDAAAHGQLNNALQMDYQDAVRIARLGGLTSVATNPDLLKNALHSSRMRGALNLDVLNPDLLKDLNADLVHLEDSRTMTMGRVRENLQVLTEAQKAALRRESQTIQDTLSNLGPGGWLALLALGGLAMMTKIGRAAAVAVAGIYLGMKFIMKDESPMKTMSGWLNFGPKVAERIGLSPPGSIVDPASRASVMIDFLEQYDPRGANAIELKATGFALMEDLALKDIAANFQINRDGHGRWFALDTTSRGLDARLRQMAERNGWSRNYRRFFNDPDSVRELVGGLGFVFYKIAEGDPNDADRVEFVNETVRMMPSGYSIDDLPCADLSPFEEPLKKRIAAANETYIDLVARGRERAAVSEQSLGDYIRDAITVEINPSIPVERTSTKGTIPPVAPPTQNTKPSATPPPQNQAPPVAPASKNAAPPNPPATQNVEPPNAPATQSAKPPSASNTPNIAPPSAPDIQNQAPVADPDVEKVFPNPAPATQSTQPGTVSNVQNTLPDIAPGSQKKSPEVAPGTKKIIPLEAPPKDPTENDN